MCTAENWSPCARAHSVSGILTRMTGLEALARLGLRQAESGNRRDQRRGVSREKQPCWPTLRGSVKGACVCKGQPLGPAPGRKPDPVICDPPPLLPWQRGGQLSKLLGRKEGGKEALPTGVAGLAIFSQKPFLARLLLPEADFSFQETDGEKRVKGPLFYFTLQSVILCQPLRASHCCQTGQPVIHGGPKSLSSSKPE